LITRTGAKGEGGDLRGGNFRSSGGLFGERGKQREILGVFKKIQELVGVYVTVSKGRKKKKGSSAKRRALLSLSFKAGHLSRQKEKSEGKNSRAQNEIYNDKKGGLTKMECFVT